MGLEENILRVQIQKEIHLDRSQLTNLPLVRRLKIPLPCLLLCLLSLSLSPRSLLLALTGQRSKEHIQRANLFV
jgi:hypothetical protein